MALTLSNAARSAAADGVVDLIDNSGPGNVEFRTGSTPGSGTILVEITFANPAFGGASNGVASVSGTPSANAVADGEAGCFEIRDGLDAVVMSGLVGDGAGGEITFDDATVVNGATITITSLTYTQPAS